MWVPPISCNRSRCRRRRVLPTRPLGRSRRARTGPCRGDRGPGSWRRRQAQPVLRRTRTAEVVEHLIWSAAGKGQHCDQNGLGEVHFHGDVGFLFQSVSISALQLSLGLVWAPWNPLWTKRTVPLLSMIACGHCRHLNGAHELVPAVAHRGERGSASPRTTRSRTGCRRPRPRQRWFAPPTFPGKWRRTPAGRANCEAQKSTTTTLPDVGGRTWRRSPGPRGRGSGPPGATCAGRLAASVATVALARARPASVPQGHHENFTPAVVMPALG